MGGVVTEGKSQGQRKQKIFLPFWREALPVCSIQIMKAKNYFACLVICVLLDITMYYISHGVFFFTGADRKGMIQGEKFLLKTVATFS